MAGVLSVGKAPIVWVAVPGFAPWEIRIKYLDPQAVKKLSASYTEKRMNPKTRQYEDVLNQEAFSKAMTREMIQDWRGLTLPVLEKMLPLNDEAKRKIQDDFNGELPFSEDDLSTLVDYTYTRNFMETVMEVATDLQRVREYEEQQLEKN